MTYLKECALRAVYLVNLKFKDRFSIDTSADIHIAVHIAIHVYFVTGLSYILQQPSTAGLAKTKADTAVPRSYATPI